MRNQFETHRVRNLLILMAVSLIVGFLIFQIAYIKYSGSSVDRPEIPRETQTLGSGPSLKYAVLGDSTAISQGGAYEKGYAVASAAHLAHDYTVQWKNVAVSGSRAADVAQKQVPQIVDFKPDLVLIAVGANDVTHLTSPSSVYSSLKQAITELRAVNPSIHIIVTGSPDMGSVPRFAQPTRWIAGKQTERLNRSIVNLAQREKLTFAPIAQQTGPIFRTHHELFAADKFHPTTAGYEVWMPVIIQAIDQALAG